METKSTTLSSLFPFKNPPSQKEPLFWLISSYFGDFVLKSMLLKFVGKLSSLLLKFDSSWTFRNSRSLKWQKSLCNSSKFIGWVQSSATLSSCGIEFYLLLFECSLISVTWWVLKTGKRLLLFVMYFRTVLEYVQKKIMFIFSLALPLICS